MLTLDDAAMFRVLLAASAIPPAELDGWLQGVAARMEARTESCRRQKRYRQRQRDGQAVLQVPCDFCALVEALLKSGRLSEAEALDRRRIDAAAAEVLADFAGRWAK